MACMLACAGLESGQIYQGSGPPGLTCVLHLKHKVTSVSFFSYCDSRGGKPQQHMLRPEPPPPLFLGANSEAEKGKPRVHLHAKWAEGKNLSVGTGPKAEEENESNNLALSAVLVLRRTAVAHEWRSSRG